MPALILPPTNTAGSVAFDIVPHWYMYPPKGCYTSGPSDKKLLDTEFSRLSGPVNLYVHIPFCNMKCSFCSLFAAVAGPGATFDDYIGSLVAEMGLVSSRMDKRSVHMQNLYIGGGTPSILPEREAQRLMNHLRAEFTTGHDASFSVEFSPETVDAATATLWASFGANRASLGVQSFNDALLRSMRRKHDGKAAQEAIDLLVNAGFRDLNIDLIYGHTDQNIGDWLDDVTRSITCGATSVTIHPLANRRMTGYKTERSDGHCFHSDERLSEFFNRATDAFRSAGWLSTSAVAFSNTNTGNPLEEAEAQGIPTVGLGAGARTSLLRLHTSSVPYSGAIPVAESLAHYHGAIQHGQLPVASWVHVTEEDQRRRRVLLSLVGRGVDELCLSQAPPPVQAVLASFESEGLVRKQETCLVLTDKGRRDAATVGLRLASSTVQRAIVGAPVA